MAITRFRGEYFYLSNMFPLQHGIETPDGVEVHTAEQLYLPARLLDKAARLAVETATDGFEAKHTLKRLVKGGSPVRPDWEGVKVEKMRDCLTVKFRINPELGEKLLLTDPEELIEGNRRNDRFWGVSPPHGGSGLNMLGKLLEETRDCLRDTSACPDFSISVDELVQRIFS